jgi:WD40 repeat protein
VVLDVRSGSQVRRFTGMRRLASAFFLTDNRLLLADDAGLGVHDLRTGQSVAWGEDEPMGRLAWPGPSPSKFLTYYGGLFLYDLRKRKFGRSFAPLLPGHLSCPTFSPGSRFLAADAYVRTEVSARRFIQVWDTRRKPLFRLFEVNSREDDLGGMAFSPDNWFLAVSVESGATLFNLDKGEQVGKDLPGPFLTQSIRFSPSGHSLELVGYRGKMTRVNPKTGRVRQESSPPPGHEVADCAVSRGGVAAGLVGKAVLFWELPWWKET